MQTRAEIIACTITIIIAVGTFQEENKNKGGSTTRLPVIFTVNVTITLIVTTASAIPLTTCQLGQHYHHDHSPMKCTEHAVTIATMNQLLPVSNK